MAYGYNFGQQNNNSIPQVGTQQNVQPLFPQPQGNVYNINSTLEVANVPCGAGISVALCLPENVMYIKTMQNGNPLFYPFKVTPLNGESKKEEKQEDAVAPPPSQSKTSKIIDDLVQQVKVCNSKISDLEQELRELSKRQNKGSDWDV